MAGRCERDTANLQNLHPRFKSGRRLQAHLAIRALSFRSGAKMFRACPSSVPASKIRGRARPMTFLPLCAEVNTYLAWSAATLALPNGRNNNAEERLIR